MAETENILWSPATNVSVVDTWEALNPKREPNNELDKDAFLQLLMTQMKYQDPLDPMDNQEFLGQMAQFTSLEQMVNLNTTYSKSQAYSMLGKQVQGVYTDPVTETSEEVAGVVKAVTTKGSDVYLTLDGGKEVPLTSVTAVGDEYETNALLDSIASDAYNTRAQAFVGKRVQAVLYDEDGKATDYVEGIVDYVKFNGSESVLMVGNKEVFPHEVASVADANGDSNGNNPFLLGRTLNVRKVNSDGATTTDETVGITDVTIKNGKAYLNVVNGEGKTDEVAIDMLNYVMDSMSFVGKRIEHESYRGTVTGVVISGGTPYMQVKPDGSDDIMELSFKTYIEEQ